MVPREISETGSPDLPRYRNFKIDLLSGALGTGYFFG